MPGRSGNQGDSPLSPFLLECWGDRLRLPAKKPLQSTQSAFMMKTVSDLKKFVASLRAMEPKELVERIQELGGKASVLDEGRTIDSFVSKSDVVCLAGSLYLIEKTDRFCQKH